MPLPAVADSSPVVLSGVSTAQGVKDLVFLTTKDGHILALDARSGATVWSHQNGPGSCSNQDGACYTTSSPAVDPGRQYVYSYGLDGYVHRYQVGSGTEVTGGGWPEQATTKGVAEKGSAALAIVVAGGATYLYVANGGYPGDFGDYQGHITAINLAGGSQKVFNTVCSNLTIHFVLNGATSGAGQNDCAEQQTAVWARPGVIYDAATNKIYLATGNGTFNPGGFDWGDTVLALNPDGTGDGSGRPLDSYTPADYQQLQNNDTDIGSTAPAILPVPAGSTVQHLAVQSGKDALLRLLNLDNLSGQGGPGHTGGEVGGLANVIGVPQGGEVLTQPAVWTDNGTTWVFVANDNGISGLRLGLNGSHVPVLTPAWQGGTGGSSPLVADGILFYAGHDGHIHALNPTTGAGLWSGGIGGIHWESPAVANGVLYITDESGNLNAFALPSAATGTPTATPTATASATRTGTATATGTATTTATRTPGATATPTRTGTATASATRTATATATGTRTPSATPTRTATAGPSSTPTRTPTPIRGGIAINSGGPAVGAFVADTDFSGGHTFSTTAAIDTSRVTNPAPMAIYQTQRHGDHTYTIRGLTPGGRYWVRLHLDEIHWTSAGIRIFNVAINGVQVLTRFDPFAAIGKADVAMVKQYPAAADASGAITVTYTSVSGNAASCAVEVLPATSLDTGLAGYWQLDEGFGTAAMDASGSGNDGTLHGGAWWASGRFGDSAGFDGSSGYLTAATHGMPAENRPMSISGWLWVPRAVAGTGDMVALANSAADSGLEMGFLNGSFAVWKHPNLVLVSTAAPSAGVWHHYAYTFDGVTHRLYIDGSLRASGTAVPSSIAPAQLMLSHWPGGGGYLRSGIDDLRLYSRALSAGEVQTLASQP